MQEFKRRALRRTTIENIKKNSYFELSDWKVCKWFEPRSLS